MTLDEKLIALYSNVDSNKLLVYRGMASDAIKNYMNIDPLTTSDVIEATYESALIQLIGNKILQEDTGGIKSYTMSKTSVTYNDRNKGLNITDDVKVLLPLPFATIMGAHRHHNHDARYEYIYEYGYQYEYESECDNDD